MRLVNPYIEFPSVGSSTTSVIPITADADDGKVAADVWTNTEVRAGTFSKIIQDAGLRFVGNAGDSLPLKNATIISATLGYEVLTVNSGPVLIDIRANDHDDAAAWNGVDPASMTPTTASTTDSISSTGAKTADVKTHLEELVARAGWVGGATGHISFGIMDNANPQDNDYILIEDLAAAGGNEATLTIVFTNP